MKYKLVGSFSEYWFYCAGKCNHYGYNTPRRLWLWWFLFQWYWKWNIQPFLLPYFYPDLTWWSPNHNLKPFQLHKIWFFYIYSWQLLTALYIKSIYALILWYSHILFFNRNVLKDHGVNIKSSTSWHVSKSLQSYLVQSQKKGNKEGKVLSLL